MAITQGRNTSASRCMVACFFVVFISIALGMVGLSYPMMHFPFSFIPIGIAVFGFIICAVLITNASGTTRSVGIGAGYSIRTTGDSMYSDHRGQPSRRSRIVFQVPNQCPSCGAPLSSESVEWVGPLQAQCPYCLATVDVSEREL